MKRAAIYARVAERAGWPVVEEYAASLWLRNRRRQGGREEPQIGVAEPVELFLEDMSEDQLLMLRREKPGCAATARPAS